jgi:hypothetical protein
MIYVLGVHHQEEQFPHPSNIRSRVDALKDFVRRVVDEHRVKLIAEEWCNDARLYQGVDRTYGEDIALEMGIAYFPCDPNLTERRKLNIKSREQISGELGICFALIQSGSEEEKRVSESADAKSADSKREKFWLEKIAERNWANENTLMICGYEHAESFTTFMQAVGYEAQNLGRVTDQLPERNS